MGFFDPLDRKLLDRIDPEVSLRAANLTKLVDYYGDMLGYHHHREVRFVLVVRYLQWVANKSGVGFLGRASTGLFASASDQAARVQSHFTSDQHVVSELVANHIGDDGSVEPPLKS